MRKCLLLLCLLSCCLGSKAQLRTFPIKISVFNESTAIPFTRFFSTPVHPGIQIGTEFNYKRKKCTRLFQTLNISYFYHNHLEQGAALHTELGYELRIRKQFSVSARLGIGYMHTFNTAEEYTLEDGHYVKKTDEGNSRICPSLSFDLGYYLKKANPKSPQLFISYQSWAEYPYSSTLIPLMPHVSLHFGTKIFLTKTTRK